MAPEEIEDREEITPEDREEIMILLRKISTKLDDILKSLEDI